MMGLNRLVGILIVRKGQKWIVVLKYRFIQNSNSSKVVGLSSSNNFLFDRFSSAEECSILKSLIFAQSGQISSWAKKRTCHCYFVDIQSQDFLKFCVSTIFSHITILKNCFGNL